MMTSDRPDRWERAAGAWLNDWTVQLRTAAVVCLVIAVGSAYQLTVNWRQAGLPADPLALFAIKGVEWLGWAAVVPIVAALDGRLARRPRPWWRRVGIHLAAATILFAGIAGLVAVVGPIVETGVVDTPSGERWLSRITVRLPSGWAVYGVIVGVVHFIRVFERSRRLDRDLASSQLQVLRDQLRPHFLFNALHTAGSLVRSGDREGTIAVVTGLADLMRRSTSHASATKVALAEEIDFLERYLDIQRRRFGPRLRVRIAVEPGLAEWLVPPFVLQPLVENALRHGVEHDPEGGDVSVVARSTPGGLRLEVEDSGGRWDGGRDTGADRQGSGLANLRRRIQVLHGEKARLEAGVEGGRTRVEIFLPREPENDR